MLNISSVSDLHLYLRSAPIGSIRGAMARRSKGGGGEAAMKGDAMRVVWRKGAVRLVLVSAIAWALLVFLALAFHLWSCSSSVAFLSALCKKDSKVLYVLDSMGLSPKPLHRCQIPVADNPNDVVIPKRTPNTIVKKLSYTTVDKQDKNPLPLFGGRQSWKQRGESFKLNATMKVSRSIGDVYLKKPEYSMDPLFRQIGPPITLKRPALSAEPSVQVRKLKPNDLFLIFASDGLWEHLSDDAAVQIVFKNPRTGIANRLVRAALKEATRKREVSFRDLNTIERGVRRHFHDDISVVVVYLDRHRGRRHTRVVDSSSNCTSAPVDIYSSSSGKSAEPLQAYRGSG